MIPHSAETIEEIVADYANVHCQLSCVHALSRFDAVGRDDRPALSFVMNTSAGDQARARYADEHGWLDERSLGPITFLPAGVDFRISGDPGFARLLVCRFRPDFFSQCTHLRALAGGSLSECANIVSPVMTWTLRRIVHELENLSDESEQAIEALCTLSLLELARHFRAPARSSGGLAAWQLRKIEHELRTATGTWPSLKHLADCCGISEDHLSHVFRNSQGMTLSAYSDFVRTKRAKDFIADGKWSMKQVAAELGFANPSTFSVAFRRCVGLSPREYRREVLMTKYAGTDQSTAKV